MNVFELRNGLVGDYSDFVRSFMSIQDTRIRQVVGDEITRGFLWPEPLIQLNPAFEPGERIDELVSLSVLHPECRKVFMKDKDSSGGGKPLRLHRHQADAIKVARGGHNYVLTTGTGSGKSLAYIVPIVDHVLRRGSGRGIQAIVVYPMNALANSQMGELRKFLCVGYPDEKGPVTFARYTGQEKDEERQAIIANPPDILLTNYVMLELLLTRPDEKPLIRSARGLQFLVLDELHTYLHLLEEQDLCEHCGASLGASLSNLFRLQNVATKRADKINCDEEERLRMGYEVISGYRFAERGGGVSSRVAQVTLGGETLATLSYGHAATLWRINLGWARRAKKEQMGFILDLERGYWSRNDQDSEDTQPVSTLHPPTRVAVICQGQGHHRV